MRTLIILAVLGMLIIPLETRAAVAVDNDVGAMIQADLLEASTSAISEGQQAHIDIDGAKILGASPATESPPGCDQAQAKFYLSQIDIATIRAGIDEDIGQVDAQPGVGGGVQLTRCIIRRTALA